jgi:hypothetical protein
MEIRTNDPLVFWCCVKERNNLYAYHAHSTLDGHAHSIVLKYIDEWWTLFVDGEKTNIKERRLSDAITRVVQNYPLDEFGKKK